MRKLAFSHTGPYAPKALLPPEAALPQAATLRQSRACTPLRRCRRRRCREKRRSASGWSMSSTTAGHEWHEQWRLQGRLRRRWRLTWRRAREQRRLSRRRRRLVQRYRAHRVQLARAPPRLARAQSCRSASCRAAAARQAASGPGSGVLGRDLGGEAARQSGKVRRHTARPIGHRAECRAAARPAAHRRPRTPPLASRASAPQAAALARRIRRVRAAPQDARRSSSRDVPRLALQPPLALPPLALPPLALPPLALSPLGQAANAPRQRPKRATPDARGSMTDAAA